MSLCGGVHEYQETQLFNNQPCMAINYFNMKRTVTFQELIEDGITVNTSIKRTGSNRRYIVLDYKHETKVIFFPKSIPDTSETVLDIERFCLLLYDTFECIVPMSYSIARANKIKLSHVPIGDKIHIHSKNGTYKLTRKDEDTFQITCDKWHKEWGWKQRKSPYETHSYDNFKCVAGEPRLVTTIIENYYT